LISLSLPPVSMFGIGSLQPAVSQVFRCSDTSSGEDEREEIRGDDSRSESRVAVGQDCDDANFTEYLNEQDRRDAEQDAEQRQDWREQSDRFACQAYGIDSPNCTHEGLRRQAQQEQEVERRQAQQEQEVERQRQQESARIQQAAQQENYFRQRVDEAQARVRSIQGDIFFWSDHPDMMRRHEQMLPLAQGDLQRAEQELQNYLNQENGR